MEMKNKKKHLVWIDLEMTGLDPKTCAILEIGAIITDSDLEWITETPAIAIHHSETVLEGMEKWSLHHHKKSGLTQACRESKVSLKAAEEEVLEFVRGHCKQHSAPLCGNTVWQDRRFLVKYMPSLEAYLHYRVVDVSSIKELVARWFPHDFRAPRKKGKAHRVMDDLREPIHELKFYRDHAFAIPSKSHHKHSLN